MSKPRLRVASSVRLEAASGGIANPRWLALLAAFETARSITAAARVAGLSYKAAWDAVDAMNNLAGTPLVATAVGGKGGGGAGLTPRGREVVAAHRLVEAENQRLVVELNARLEGSGGSEGLRTLDRLSLRTSARNQWVGQVTAVKAGAVNDEVQMHLPSGDMIVATVTHESAEGLDLRPGCEVVALVKASAVMLAAGDAPLRISARNQYLGTVTRLVPGAVNTEVVLALRGGLTVTAVITKAAAQELGLAAGAAARAFFDASAVLLAVR